MNVQTPKEKKWLMSVQFFLFPPNLSNFCFLFEVFREREGGGRSGMSGYGLESVTPPLMFAYFDFDGAGAAFVGAAFVGAAFVGTGAPEVFAVTTTTTGGVEVAPHPASVVIFTGAAPPVEIAVQTSSVVLAGAADWGVNTGTVTVHLLHVVMVSVVRKVEVLVMVSMDVFPFLVWVVVVGGQSVTVV